MPFKLMIPMNISVKRNYKMVRKILLDLKVKKNMIKVHIKGLHKYEAQSLESW